MKDDVSTEKKEEQTTEPVGVSKGGPEDGKLTDIFAKFAPIEEKAEDAPAVVEKTEEKKTEDPAKDKEEAEIAKIELSQEELVDVPKDKTREAFIRERKRNKLKLERVRQEYEAKLVMRDPAAEKKMEQPAEKPIEKKPVSKEELQTPEYTAKVFDLWAKCNDVIHGIPQDGIDLDEAKRLMGHINAFRGDMSNPENMLSIIEQAKAGAFGDASEDIRIEAEKELPVVQARAMRSAKQNDIARVQTEQTQQQIHKEIADACAEYPELLKVEPGKESEETVFARKWFTENVIDPTTGNVGRRFAEMSPGKAAGLVKDMMTAFHAEKYRALRQQGERRKTAEAEAGGAPLSGGAGRSGGGSAKGGSSEALSAIFNKFGGKAA